MYSKESPTKNESLLAVTVTGEWSPSVPGAPSLHLDKGGCFIFIYKKGCHIHLYSTYRSSCTRDACQTIPQHYPQRTTMPTHLSVNASSGFWRTWAFLKGQVLGVTKRTRTSTIYLQEQTYKQSVKRWHWKYTKYTLYSLFSSSYLCFRRLFGIAQFTAWHRVVLFSK